MSLSIRQYIIIFSVLIALLTSFFIYKIKFNLNENQYKIELSQKKSAHKELQKAIDLTFKKIKIYATELSQWQEVKQQINNPEIFAYWYNVRLKKHAYDLQKNTIELMIYNINGNALSKLDDNTLPYSIDINNINGFLFRVTGPEELIYIMPVYNEKSDKTIIGFISSRLEFITILKSVIHFQYLDPETLTIDMDDEIIIRDKLTSSDFVYNLNKSEEIEILENQINNSLNDLVMFIALPTIIIFMIIIYLIGRPIQDVVLYIEKLRRSPGFVSKTDYNHMIKVKELNAIYESLKQYHVELSKNEEYLDLTLNSIGDAVITTDAKYNITRMNPVAERLTGWASEDAINNSINNVLNLFNSATGEPINNPFDSVIKKGEIIHINKNIKLLSKNGKTYYISDSAAPILDENNVTRGIVLVFNDITEQKIKDEQLQQSQKMDALGKLTGGISHDFNNMIGIILGYSELLQLTIDKKTPSHNHVNEIIKAAMRSQKLTSKLLAFSRKSMQEESEININELIVSEQNMLKKMLTVRIELILKLEQNLWSVYVDASLLQDAILNICINAMHAMPNGGKLTIHTHNIHFDTADMDNIQLEEGDYVQLSITDTGSGMDKETQLKVFDPFFSTKGEKGTGLGLSQVYGLVSQSRGAVHVYSELDIGTKFSIYLPRYTSTPDEDESKNKASTESTTSLYGKETILLVDDEDSLLNLSDQIIKKYGYQTLLASSGEEALSLLEKNHADLVLSDIIMPNMDGYQLAEVINKKYPHMKIQLISGFSEEPVNSILASNLYFNQINKPFSTKELLETIRKLLDS